MDLFQLAVWIFVVHSAITHEGVHSNGTDNLIDTLHTARPFLSADNTDASLVGSVNPKLTNDSEILDSSNETEELQRENVSFNESFQSSSAELRNVSCGFDKNCTSDDQSGLTLELTPSTIARSMNFSDELTDNPGSPSTLNQAVNSNRSYATYAIGNNTMVFSVTGAEGQKLDFSTDTHISLSNDPRETNHFMDTGAVDNSTTDALTQLDEESGNLNKSSTTTSHEISSTHAGAIPNDSKDNVSESRATPDIQGMAVNISNDDSYIVSDKGNTSEPITDLPSEFKDSSNQEVSELSTATEYFTTSKAESGIHHLNSAQHVPSTPNETPPIGEISSTPLKPSSFDQQLAFSENQHDVSTTSEETTHTYSEKLTPTYEIPTSINGSSSMVDVNNSLDRLTVSNAVNEITGETLKKTSKNDIRQSTTSDMATIHSVSNSTSHETLIKTGKYRINHTFPTLGSQQDSNSIPHFEDSANVISSQTTLPVTHSTRVYLNESNIEMDSIQILRNTTDHPSTVHLNDTETTFPMPNINAHNFSDFENGVEPIDGRFKVTDDSVKTTSSSQAEFVSESGITELTRILPTIKTYPTSGVVYHVDVSIAEDADNFSTVHNLTQYSKITRTPKLLSVLYSSLPPAIFLTPTSTAVEDDTPVSTFDSATDFDNVTTTESSIPHLTKGARSFAAQNESTEILETIFVALEDINELDRRNIITASFTVTIKRSDREWLENQTMLFHTWVLKTVNRTVSYPLDRISEEDRSHKFYSVKVFFILPTPIPNDTGLSFTFIVKNVKNASIPAELMISILTSNADEILTTLNATASLFTPGFPSDHPILKEGGFLETFENDHGYLYIAVGSFLLLMLLILFVIICCMKCKKKGSADFQFDKINFDLDLQQATDIGHINSALSAYHYEENKKLAISNGLRMYSVDDNEGWVVPMGQKPIIDLNAPASQDTSM